MPRWDLHPLLLVLLTMTWTCGDSLPERFEAARGFYVLCHEKKKRPGETFQGFQLALEKLAMPVLRTVAAGIRRQLEKHLAKRLTVEGFIPLGCDGTRCECPRTEELKKRLGVFGKEDSAPMLWITALVHLPTGVPWILGNHRLLCGDSSKPEDIDRLLGGAKIQLVNTDPPYNVKVEPRSNIAAEQTGRKAFLMELDELYCDVIVQRWEQFTGKKAERGNAETEDVA